ncbi:thrombospondin-4-like [Apostichopus japonicus]|uniref:thrombospondin-4-like n=1 Tax=Stichopus japonicus TaxID=307972 RepID=UPI003AB1569C
MPNTVCVNTIGSYDCPCITDYTWDGEQCAANPYRRDGRCRHGFIAPNFQEAICDKTGPSPCCSDAAWCGSSYAHCFCSRCVDYRTK